MSSSPAARPLRLPPTDFDRIKIPKTRQPPRNWFRVHQSGYPAIFLSLNTAHRFSHKDSPYPFLYLGIDIETCLFERFGDKTYDDQMAIAQSIWYEHSLSTVQIPEVHVCDLTSAKTLSSVRVDLTALMHNNIAIPQEWGLAIQRHPANFQGIKFKSRFNGRVCLALFKRDGIEKRLRETLLDSLPNNEKAVDWLDKHKVSLY